MPVPLDVDFFPRFDLKLDFLSSDVMHGEGNIISHLVIVGYKVSYKQVCISIHLLCLFPHVRMSCLFFNRREAHFVLILLIQNLHPSVEAFMP